MKCITFRVGGEADGPRLIGPVLDPDAATAGGGRTVPDAATFVDGTLQ